MALFNVLIPVTTTCSWRAQDSWAGLQLGSRGCGRHEAVRTRNNTCGLPVVLLRGFKHDYVTSIVSGPAGSVMSDCGIDSRRTNPWMGAMRTVAENDRDWVIFVPMSLNRAGRADLRQKRSSSAVKIRHIRRSGDRLLWGYGLVISIATGAGAYGAETYDYGRLDALKVHRCPLQLCRFSTDADRKSR